VKQSVASPFYIEKDDDDTDGDNDDDDNCNDEHGNKKMMVTAYDWL
jgi:hypothetical protein